MKQKAIGINRLFSKADVTTYGNTDGGLASRALIALILRALGVLAGFAMHMVLARYLGATDYGILNYALVVSTIFTAIVPFGWPTAIVRLIPQYLSVPNWELVRGAISWSLATTVVASCIASVFLLAIRSFLDNELATSITFAAYLIPVVCFSTIRKAIFQGFHWTRSAVVWDEIAVPALVATTLLLTSNRSLTTVYSCYFVISFMLALTSIWWFVWHAPLELRRSAVAADPRTWRRMLAPMWIGGINQVVLASVGHVVLGWFSDMPAVAIYSVSYRIALVCVFAMTAANIVASPMLASAFYGGRKDELRRIVRWTTIWSFTGGLPIFLTAVIWPSQMLELFGSEFSDPNQRGTLVLQILVAGQMLNAATGLVGSLLVLTGREKTFFWITSGITAFAVLASIVVTPRLGAPGAALVSAVSTGALNMLLFLFAYGHLTDHHAGSR